MRFKGLLCTMDSVPAYTAPFELEADSASDAESQALKLDPDDLKWSDDLGRPKDWNEIDASANYLVPANVEAAPQ